MCWPVQRVSLSLSPVTLSPCLGHHKIGGKGGSGIDARGRRVCAEVPPIVADDELVTLLELEVGAAGSIAVTDLARGKVSYSEVRVQVPSGSFA